MSATVVPLPPNSSSETVDFLRRMASMVSGRNGEMLLRAASLIESLSQRAMTVERLYHQAQDESTRHVELREAAELASDAMVGQIEALRAQLAEVTAATAAERAAYDAEMSKFSARHELQAATWTQRVLNRLAPIKAMNGRETLRAALAKMGFEIR